MENIPQQVQPRLKKKKNLPIALKGPYKVIVVFLLSLESLLSSRGKAAGLWQ